MKLGFIVAAMLATSIAATTATSTPAPQAVATPLPCFGWKGPNPNHATVANNVDCKSLPKARLQRIPLPAVPSGTACVSILNLILKQPFIVGGKTAKDTRVIFVSKNTDGQDEQVYIVSLDQLRAIAKMCRPSPLPSPDKP